jgi:hypothetical protein
VKTRFFLVGLILTIPAVLQASSVAQVSFDELVASSEFIFEGRAIGRRAELDSRGMIHTYVTFEVLDVLKGFPAGRIELRYLGGTVGGLTLDVSDLSLPNESENGIYFVESIGRFQAHPLYGWDQGHFVIAGERILSRTGKPITGIESVSAKAAGLSTGVASGVSVADAGRPGQAMTVREFKQKVREFTRRR